MRAVAITGTRSTAHRSSAEYAALFADYLAPFATADSRCYVGGAKGIDSLSLWWLADRTRALLVVVVPGTVGQQPPEAQQVISRCRDRIEEIVELRAAELCGPAFHARNRYMVDRASMTVGFPHHQEVSSGTWQTLDYTSELRKPRLIVPV